MTVTIESGGPLAAPLDGLKAYLRITSDNEDALLTDLIRAATDVAERFIGQLLIARGVEEMLEPSRDWRALAIRPVTSIDAVAGVPASGEEFALPVDAYAIDIDGNGDGWVRVSDAGRRRTYSCQLSGRTGGERGRYPGRDPARHHPAGGRLSCAARRRDAASAGERCRALATLAQDDAAMSAELAARAAIVAALGGDEALAGLVNQIADGEPVKASPPWLLVGAATATGWGARGVDGVTLRQTLELNLRGDQLSAVTGDPRPGRRGAARYGRRSWRLAGNQFQIRAVAHPAQRDRVAGGGRLFDPIGAVGLNVFPGVRSP